eukprot:6189052-Pleurochrysis_carterae.AAC.1
MRPSALAAAQRATPTGSQRRAKACAEALTQEEHTPGAAPSTEVDDGNREHGDCDEERDEDGTKRTAKGQLARSAGGGGAGAVLEHGHVREHAPSRQHVRRGLQRVVRAELAIAVPAAPCNFLAVARDGAA